MLRQFLSYTFDVTRYSVFPGDGCLFSRNQALRQLPKALFVKDHLVRPEYREDPILYLVRDGRDSILSYARYLFASGEYSNVGRGELADFIRKTASDYWLFWADNVKRALDGIEAGWPITLLRYEDIYKRPEALYQLADRLNTSNLPLRRDYTAYEKHEKSEKAKLAIYPEWSDSATIPKDSFLAEGWTVGGGRTDWRAAFDARARREFHELGGTDILLRLGYETSADWWRAADLKSNRTTSVAKPVTPWAYSPFAYGHCEICGSRFKILLRHVGTAQSQKLVPLYYCMDCESFTCIGDYVDTAEQARADVEHYIRNVDFKRKNFGLLAEFLSGTLFDGHPEGVSHADIGCGIGALVKAFADAGYQTAGYDIDCFAIERAKTLFVDLDFRHEAAGSDDRQFDLVTLIDVLEHVKEPATFFEALVGCLRPGGYLFVVVPRLDRDEWSYLDEPVHLQFSVRDTTPFRDNDVHVVHYSSKGLERIGLRHGLEVVRDCRDQAWPLNGVLYRRL
jgi:SAM-dependent methyltransferase